MIFYKITLILSFTLASYSFAAPTTTRAIIIADGFKLIWGFEFISPEQILLTEKRGSIWLYNLKTKTKLSVANAPRIVEKGQGGLLDIKLHPKFNENSWVYYSYVAEYLGGQGTVIERAKLIKKKEIYLLEDHQRLFRAEPPGNGGRHFGSRITFDEKGYVYFSVGERGERKLAQDLSFPNGKIFRLHDDGKIPQDNPFVKRKGALKAIWSYGHRNPQGLMYSLKDKKLYEQEHGPRGGDEINIILKAKNYGWPIATYGKEYWGPSIGVEKKTGIEPPLKYFVPSIAPSGLLIYSGKSFKEWSGHIFSGALKLTHLNKVDASGKNEQRLFEDLNERVRDIREGPEGGIYFSTDSGRIYKIMKSSQPAS